MPIYEYRCESCGHELESIQKMSEDHLVDCPACTKPTLKRLISAAGFRLKGGGWYETDFKSKNRKNVLSEEKSSKASGESKTTEKSSSKGDSKKTAATSGQSKSAQSSKGGN